jgi:hypothetical protein
MDGVIPFGDKLGKREKTRKKEKTLADGVVRRKRRMRLSPSGII